MDSIPPAQARQPVYLDLGDSVGMWNGERSYPNLVTAFFRKDLPRLQLVNLACSGETTQTMMAHSLCAPGGSQLRNAVSFLRTHRGAVALVTIDIGGNDVVNCVSAANPTTCFTKNLVVMKGQLTYILDALRQAAGPSVPIVGMNVFDPLLGDWLGPRASRTEASTGVSAVSMLDSTMSADYRAVASPVADVATAFASTDMTHFVSSRWGRVPVAVARACTLLDITCHKGQSEGFGDDPDGAGARVIARTFETTIGHLRPPA
ncbi:MAG TPA: SGNH/GDSL hydrolase family protein [Acidimicrobiales bacterium]|nr:SGNH/GDSL hydrolase family protein [Acidimicrobiales bacterium]